jgi:hypothetical protein
LPGILALVLLDRLHRQTAPSFVYGMKKELHYSPRAHLHPPEAAEPARRAASSRPLRLLPRDPIVASSSPSTTITRQRRDAVKAQRKVAAAGIPSAE